MTTDDDRELTVDEAADIVADAAPAAKPPTLAATIADVEQELRAEGHSAEEAQRLAPAALAGQGSPLPKEAVEIDGEVHEQIESAVSALLQGDAIVAETGTRPFQPGMGLPEAETVRRSRGRIQDDPRERFTRLGRVQQSGGLPFLHGEIHRSRPVV